MLKYCLEIIRNILDSVLWKQWNKKQKIKQPTNVAHLTKTKKKKCTHLCHIIHYR